MSNMHHKRPWETMVDEDQLDETLEVKTWISRPYWHNKWLLVGWCQQPVCCAGNQLRILEVFTSRNIYILLFSDYKLVMLAYSFIRWSIWGHMDLQRKIKKIHFYILVDSILLPNRWGALHDYGGWITVKKVKNILWLLVSNIVKLELYLQLLRVYDSICRSQTC